MPHEAISAAPSPMISTARAEANVLARSSRESVTTRMKVSPRAWTGVAKILSDSSSIASPGRSTNSSLVWLAVGSCSGVRSRTSAWELAATTPPAGARI